MEKTSLDIDLSTIKLETSETSKTEIYENLDIIELITELDKNFGFENSKMMKEWFGVLKFRVNYPYKFCKDYRFLLIKYIDGICKLWKPKWARQCRGVLLFKSKTGKIFIIKYLLQRGAELISKIHLSNNISTQDMKIENLTSFSMEQNTINSKFDNIQQETISLFKKGGPIKGYLSFKVDGSLLGINIVNKRCEIFSEIEEIYEKYSSTFHKNIKIILDKLNFNFLPLFSTQSTIFIGDDMIDYFITAIICDFNKIDYDELKCLADKYNPAEFLIKYENYFIDFLRSIDRFYNQNFSNYDIICLSFEAVCQNRKTAWNSSLDHTRTLAVNYPTCMLRFLGMTVGNGLISPEYIGHFQIEDIVNMAGWDQPLFWKVVHTDDAYMLLSQLDMVISGNISEEQFLINNPSSNNKCITTDKTYLDYEGFIFYRVITSHSSNKFEKLDYSKLKTNSYYVSHKPNGKYVQQLLKFSPDAEKIFPNSKIFKNLHFDYEIKIKNFFIRIHLFFKSNERLYFQELPENERLKVSHLSPEIIRKFLISHSNISKKILENVYKMAFEEFGKFKESEEIRKLLSKVTFNFECWREVEDHNLFYEKFKLENKFYHHFSQNFFECLLNSLFCNDEEDK